MTLSYETFTDSKFAQGDLVDRSDFGKVPAQLESPHKPNIIMTVTMKNP
jgi:hypothetical protein